MTPKVLFEPAKLFLKSWGQPDVDWKEIGFLEGRTSLATDDYDDGPDIIHYSIPGTSFSVTIKITRKKSIRLQQVLGLLKSPRCTYKTVRRNCAKRNRIK